MLEVRQKNVEKSQKPIALLTGILPYFLGGLGQKKCDNRPQIWQKFDKNLTKKCEKNVKKMWNMFHSLYIKILSSFIIYNIYIYYIYLLWY
jgi:hypothetical protein